MAGRQWTRDVLVGLTLGLVTPALAQEDDGLPGRPVLPSDRNRASAPEQPAGQATGKKNTGQRRTPPLLPVSDARARGSFIGLSGIVRDHASERGRAAARALRGTKLGTWQGWTDSDLTYGRYLGRFRTREDAVRVAQQHFGPAAIRRVPGHPRAYDVLDLNTGSDDLLTSDRVGKVTIGEGDDAPQAIVSEDGAVFRNRGKLFSPSYGSESRIWTPERVADELYLAMKGPTTDEERLFEALANLDPDDRAKFPRVFDRRLRLRNEKGNLKDWLDGDLSNVGGKRRLADAMLSGQGPIVSRAEIDRSMRSVYRGADAQPVTNSARLRDVPRLTWFLANHADSIDSGTPEKFHTGQEYALKRAIESANEPLSPGQVVELALELNQGDAYKALLTAHNTLRAAARGQDSALNQQVPTHLRRQELFGEGSDPDLFKKHLQPIRGGGDESGAWYHMFGVATMSMAGGESAAANMARFEEYAVARDAWSDPMELYVDKLGARMGTRLKKRVARQ